MKEVAAPPGAAAVGPSDGVPAPADRSLVDPSDPLQLAQVALDGAPLGTIVTSTRANGRCLYVNPEFTRITGYGLDDIPTTADWLLRAYPDAEYRSQVLANWADDVDPANMGRDVRYEITCRDGQRRLICFRASELSPELMLVTLHDVTREHEMQRALEASERRYRQVSEAISDLAYCFTVAPDGALKLDWLAGALQTLLGREPTGPPRLDAWIEMILPEDLPGALAAHEEVRAGAARAIEYRIRNAAGELRWMRDYSRPVRDPDTGRVVEIFGAVQDVSEIKLAEQEALRLQRQVAQGQKTESLALLAGGVAHDFNNLLQGILGNADLIAQHLQASSRAAEQAADIRTAAERAAALARQLLSYAGQGRMATEPLDLAQVVQENLRLLGATVSPKATITSDVDAALPTVRGDATQICQVLMNLLTNASEALRGRPGTIALRGCTVEAGDLTPALMAVGAPLGPGPYACLEVSDDGRGISSDDAARIFDPFFSTKARSGRGLGLAASAGIVQAHGGRIRVHSVEDQGTRVQVLLPQDPTARPRARPATEKPAARFDGLCTLLVDDDRLARRVGRAMLERLGFEVHESSGGRLGLQRLRVAASEYAVVLLDLAMPDMDGGEVLVTLREEGIDLPVLVVSGYGEQLAAGHWSDPAGKTGFLHKPFSLEELSATLNALLERS